MALSKPGDICENCRERWEKANKPPLKLVELPVVTKRYGEALAICTYCDGPAFEVAAAAAKRKEDDAAKS